MPYSVIQVAQVPASVDEHPASSPWDRRLNDALGITAFGLYQVELPPDGETVPHDHRDDGAEDAYVLVGGSAALLVDGDQVPLRTGDAAAVTPESRRWIRAGSDGCTIIAVCA
ncbi:cupin domain-containing protein [Curtobacterium sp. MCSS17_015]|uniref:cupin domain-containing protein n=1 Tax=Curtobacterium sp. MCSS17_015 TaxID=2175666 RepID=UPI000DA9B382|nr:cupin domain-containing protein [Curtobacterium sp. MCSS17_015]WIB26734.1 hypothetical protein DEJ18_01180 [Curtobacterium sp. MCSS17_015]